MVTIGITGPTGCGKTTLLQEIAARGGEIVDCDALYYELLKTDPTSKRRLQPRLAISFFRTAVWTGRSLRLWYFPARTGSQSSMRSSSSMLAAP
ncbi:MAG: hypothetical protein ACLR8U_06230 [Oscillospiraceae bacterium]